MALLESLGPRIAILGPSNSGKSTLAQAIARQRGLPVTDRFKPPYGRLADGILKLVMR